MAFVRFTRTGSTGLAYESHSFGFAVGDNWNIRHLNEEYTYSDGFLGFGATYHWDVWACSENIGGSSGVYFIRMYDN
jgi:hypothetical protein